MINERQLTPVVIGLALAMAAGVLTLWFRATPSVPVTKRVADLAAEQRAGTLKPANPSPATPVSSPAGSPPAAPPPPVDLRGSLQTFDGQPASSTAVWPQFRGPDFSNVINDGPPLAESWTDQGPPVLWSVGLSEGHSGPAVWHGTVYIMDYDEAREGDLLRAFSLADGREIWRRWYRSPTKRNHGVSRTVPAVTEKFVVTLGPRCHVSCVDRLTGSFRWGLDLVAEFGAEIPLWYTGQNPLVDGDTVVLAPGGPRALLIGLDGATGRVLWETPNPDRWKMSHSSISPMTLLGRRMYVYSALGGAVGVAADGPDRGKALWTNRDWIHSVLAPSALGLGPDRVFLTAGYGGGSLLLGLKTNAGSFQAETVYRLDKTVFSCEQHTPVFFENCLFAVLPKDAGEKRAQFACCRPDGRLAWTSGPTERFGLGPFLVADRKIFILNDNGELTLIRASTEGYVRLARAKVLRGRDAWAPMALIEGRLLLRDSEKLICLDVRRR